MSDGKDDLSDGTPPDGTGGGPNDDITKLKLTAETDIWALGIMLGYIIHAAVLQ